MPKLIPCRTQDPDLWFPVGTTGPSLIQAAQAVALCHTCPIEQECLTGALAIMPAGIWGGTTEEERRALKTKRHALASSLATSAGR